jgi:hypothetical protein
MAKLGARITIRKLDRSKRTSPMYGYDFRGWDCEGGWLVASPQLERYSDKAIWVDRVRDFYAIPLALAGQEVIEISPVPAELTDPEKKAILNVAWHWEFWEPTLRDGTCMVQSLEKALDLTIADIREMFMRAYRDPSRKEHVVEVLEQNGYKVQKFGPEGFSYRDDRRIVTMNQIANPTDGHAVLVYENDKDIFDSSGKFKKVSDLMWAPNWGYKLGDVLIIEKA